MRRNPVIAAAVGCWLAAAGMSHATVVVTSNSQTAARGEEVAIVYAMSGTAGDAATYLADVTFDAQNLDIASVCGGGSADGLSCSSAGDCPGGLCLADCEVAPRLVEQIGQFARPTPDTLILFVGDTQFPVDLLGDGQLLICTFRVADDAPDGVYPLGTTFLEVGDADARVLDAESIDGSITVCETSPAVAFSFAFSVEPAAPVVGDSVRVSVDVSNTTGGAAGLPAYTLRGARPFLEGDTMQLGNVNVLGSDTATFDLEAVQEGAAQLQLNVSYETQTGCLDNPVFFFTSTTSAPFAVDVAGSSSMVPTVTPTVPGGGPMPVGGGSSSSGCSASPGRGGGSGAVWLLVGVLWLGSLRRKSKVKRQRSKVKSSPAPPG